jgi:uncharacterized protein YkwD
MGTAIARGLIAAGILFLVLTKASAGGLAAANEESTAAAMISRYRAANGLGPVKPDPQLSAAARQQADAMAARGVMSHDVAGDFGSRMRAMGIVHVAAAENIGAGFHSVAAVLEGWQKSTGHRENLLMPNVTRIGLARRDAPGKPYGVYWALVLAGPKPSSVGPGQGPGRAGPLPFGLIITP